MVFNSAEFLIFFAVTFLLYYSIKPSWQWGFLIIASAFFLMYHVPAFILIIVPVIFINYFSGLGIQSAKTEKNKKRIFILSTIINLGILGFFKYINFLISNIGFLVHLVKPETGFTPISIILPLGISFYIFQVIGYNIEIYWENEKAERHLGHFAAYVLFFPKLISGPIERAHLFLPQIKKGKIFNNSDVTAGFQLILWGLFKKLVIADRIDPVTNLVFNNINDYHGLSILIGIGLYIIQLYADFSGYTDIALGLASTLGYKLTDNFNRPFLSTSISEFWRRWHITLSSWVRDYIYTPVSANKRHWGRFGIVYSLILTFVALGFWHGASWNFVIYGFLHAMAVSYEFITRKFRQKMSKLIPSVIYIPFSRIMTITFLGFTMIFFRLHSFSDITTCLNNLISGFTLTTSGLGLGISPGDVIILIAGVFIIEFVEWLKSKNSDLGSIINKKPAWVRLAVYYIFVLSIMLFGSFGVSEFIYFQF